MKGVGFWLPNTFSHIRPAHKTWNLQFENASHVLQIVDKAKKVKFFITLISVTKSKCVWQKKRAYSNNNSNVISFI